jgi:hypothetical protein
MHARPPAHLCTHPHFSPAGDPHWWRVGLEQAAGVQDKLNELSDKYQGMAVWAQVAAAVSGELSSAVQQLKVKQAERFFRDDERDVRSALGNVTRHLSARDPAWCVSCYVCVSRE